jgi:hypothetical protein
LGRDCCSDRQLHLVSSRVINIVVTYGAVGAGDGGVALGLVGATAGAESRGGDSLIAPAGVQSGGIAVPGPPP